MGLPKVSEARPFYRAGKQRFEDARLLLDKAGRTTGAIYLAGYGIECLLKALVLSVVPAHERAAMVADFRGARAHNYDWLRSRYFGFGGSPFPREIAKSFALLNTWDTEWRYRSGTAPVRQAERFLQTAEQFIVWADGRL
ncbi:MAG: HEPN domain-containing protein [Planctomycetes bacterium]|nr:HEPN domain-containing protein [Planctomycetota bacterium]